MRTRSPLQLWVLAALLPLAACSAYDGQYDDSRVTDSGLVDSDEFDSADTDPPPVEVEFWSLDGGLAVLDGKIDAANSTLRAGLWAGREQACADLEAVLTDVVELENHDSEIVLLGWWAVQIEVELSSDCVGTIPGELRVGIGAMDPRLTPAMRESGLDPQTLDLYGLYAQLDADGPVYVFGVAGTVGQFQGTEGTTTDGRLPDAVFELRTLHLLPL